MASSERTQQRSASHHALVDQLNNLAEKGITTLEQVCQNRRTVLQMYEALSDVFAAAQTTLNSLADGAALDAEFDTFLLGELERTRGDLDKYDAAQLDDASRLVAACADGATNTLAQVAPLASRCERLLRQRASIRLLDSGARCELALGRVGGADGNLTNACLAAAVLAHRLGVFRPTTAASTAASSAAAEAKPGVIGGGGGDHDAAAATRSGAEPKSFSATLKIATTAAPTKRPLQPTPAAAATAAAASTGLTSANVKKSNKKTSGKITAAPERPLAAAASTTNTTTRSSGYSDDLCLSTYYLLVENSGGEFERVVIELDLRAAPQLCANFVRLCDDGHYNCTKFHRSLAGELLYGGWVDSLNGRSILQQASGSLVAAEPSSLPLCRGAVFMEAMGKHAGSTLIGSSFVVCLSSNAAVALESGGENDAAGLVFGRVLSGLSVLERLSWMPADQLKQAATVVLAATCEQV